MTSIGILICVQGCAIVKSGYRYQYQYAMTLGCNQYQKQKEWICNINTNTKLSILDQLIFVRGYNLSVTHRQIVALLAPLALAGSSTQNGCVS